MRRRRFFAALAAAAVAAARMRAQVQSDFDAKGMNIHYLQAGSGDPVLLLHGFIFSLRPAWIEGGFFDALSRTNTVVALDLPGHGASGKSHDPNRYGLEMIHDVLRLMDRLRFERALLLRR